MKRNNRAGALIALSLVLVLSGCDLLFGPDDEDEGGINYLPGYGIYSEARLGNEMLVETDAGTGTVTATPVSDAAAAFEGSEYLAADYQQTDWGGYFFDMATPADASAYADGMLVFTVDYSAIAGIDVLEVKVASGAYPTEAGGIVNLFGLTPTATDGTWESYEIPLASFTSYNRGLPDWTALTTFAGFWNPMVGGSVANGIIKFDDVHFTANNTLALSTLTAPAVNLVAGGSTGVAIVTATYANGATAKVPNGDLASWASDDTTVATVAAGVISPVAAGTANVTASFGGETVTIALTVASDLSEIGVYSETFVPETSPTLTSNILQGWGGATITLTADSTAVLTADGTKTLKADFAGGDWSGAIYNYSAPGLDVSAYTSFVFSVNKSAMPTLENLEIKFEDGTANAVVLTNTLSPQTSGDWLTYTVPLSGYSAVNLSALTVIGLWNPKAGDTFLSGTLYFDNLHFVP